MQRDSHGVEFGLYDGSELGLQLELALQALNLDLLLLDEAPLFFKLRANSVSLNHFPSSERASANLRQPAEYNRYMRQLCIVLNTMPTTPGGDAARSVEWSGIRHSTDRVRMSLRDSVRSVESRWYAREFRCQQDLKLHFLFHGLNRNGEILC